MAFTAACLAAAGQDAPCLASRPSMFTPARPLNPSTRSSISFSPVFSLSSSSSTSSPTPLHLLALAALVLLGCPSSVVCDPSSGASTTAITAALVSSSSLQLQQHHPQQQRQKQVHHSLQDRHQHQIQLQEVRRRNHKRRLAKSNVQNGSGSVRGRGRDRDRDNGRIWLMQGRSLTANDDHTDSGVSFPSTFSSASRLTNLSMTETTLASLLGVALALVVLGVCVCIVKKRRRARSWSLSRSEPPSFSVPSQPQQLAVPLYQPPETSSSLSSFTRVSAAGPEMSSVLAAAGARSGAQSSHSRSPSSAVVGFSLARLFVRHPRERGAGKSGKSVYMHQKDPIQDWRSQKTPSPVSTRSSSHDYCWSDLRSKEYAKDGFPIITLTSPTNSESSIPLPVASTDPIAASSSTASTSSTCMPLSEQLAPEFFQKDAVSKTGTLKDMDGTLAPVSEDKDSSIPSIYAADHQSLYISRQAVPQHMLLHPSFTHNRISRIEKQTLAPPSTSLPLLTDFPPTYEEAVDDAGASTESSEGDQSNSGSSSNSSNSSNSNSSTTNTNTNSDNNSSGSCEIMSISASAPPAACLFPAMGPYSSCPRVLSAESMDWASYRNRTEWNAEYGAEGEVDPLGSLSLSSNH